MTRYRFIDAMGDVVDERDCADHDEAIALARADEDLDVEIQRVEYRGPEGDWRWAGPLSG